jgi:hypothetical protein
MEGAVTAFSGTSMTVNVDAVGGSGTYASWNISVAGIAGSNTSVPGTSGQVLVSNGSSGFGTPFSLGTNVQTFLTTPSSANLASALTDKTGTGVNVFATSPSLTTPAIGSGGFTLAGSTSGTTTVAASATASGTITIPAATDTLVGKATTDTLTNKTFDTAGTGNVFKINGTQITANTGTGSNVLATSPSISGLTLTGSLTAGGGTGTSGQVLSSTGTGIQWITSSGSGSSSGSNMYLATYFGGF